MRHSKGRNARHGDDIRAVIIADYEKSSPVHADIQHLLDAEAGGAVAAFKQILRDPVTDEIDPILVTGSSVLVDDDLAPRFLDHAREWMHDQGHNVVIEDEAAEGFHLIHGTGADWCPRNYVAMVTAIFQKGISRCLVGTRGLLGEGWDAHKVNTLIDITTATTSKTVNQLRGRSYRLDPDVPRKVADNWDVVCLAPEFMKGLDDYHRFRKKHASLFGVTDDGIIEKGVGHVHPAFTDAKPEGVEESMSWLNEEMLGRAAQRAEAYTCWKIGVPYKGVPNRSLELNLSKGGGGGFPPFGRTRTPWTDASLRQAIGNAVAAALSDAQLITLKQRKAPARVSERQDGYLRIILKKASPEDMELFTRSVRETFDSLSDARYLVPRTVRVFEKTWFSKMLPRVVGRYFDRRTSQLIMWHKVPTALATKKDLALLFQKHWNHYVSPGEIVYAHRDEGRAIQALANENDLAPDAILHEKEVFV